MARKPSGKDLLAKAYTMLPKVESAHELRQLLALILPLEFGLSLEQTAKATGVSLGWISQLRNDFIRRGGDWDEKHPRRGGRYHQNMSFEEETRFLVPFLSNANNLVVKDIKVALEKRLGKKVALSSVYNLLHRHNWKKTARNSIRSSLSRKKAE